CSGSLEQETRAGFCSGVSLAVCELPPRVVLSTTPRPGSFPAGLSLHFPPQSVADSWWVAELLWTFFVPFTVYQLGLPGGEEGSACAAHPCALQLLAVELGVVSTRLTAADKAEYVKRMRHNPPTPHPPAALSRPRSLPSSEPGPGSQDGHVTGLAQRVQEVLPHVPLSAICRDLAQTHCVDTTIANLLEEQVPFTPPAADPETKALFARSPVERHMSLQERKQALYDSARR
uniref:CUE domain-containing protein n=1 Tax=Sphenodon punctatus TaxID=8508 RepID=A0A8D0GUU7_SPHPU